MAFNKIARKGVKSRTAIKPAWPMRHSSSVKNRKRYIVRIGDMFHMNGKFSKDSTLKPFCPDAGRFMNQDPIGLEEGFYVYQFAPNAPDWVDPLGLSKCSS